MGGPVREKTSTYTGFMSPKIAVKASAVVKLCCCWSDDDTLMTTDESVSGSLC